MKKIIFLMTLALASSAFAKVKIRVPVLVGESHFDSKSFNIGEFKEVLAAKGIEIPDYIEVGDSKDGERLSKFSELVDQAELKAGKELLYLKMYGRLSDYQGKGITYPICYTQSRHSNVAQAAQEAFQRVQELGDGVLSDQYSIIGYRFYGDKEFTLETDVDEPEVFFKKYLRKTLKPGDIQIVATTNDSGDDDADDILSVCK